MTTIVASKTLINTISVYDKEKTLIINEYHFYSDEACTNEITSFIENSIYYILIYGKNLYQWDDITYSNTLTVNFANGYGTVNCEFDSTITDGSSYIKGKYKLTFGEFSQADTLNSINLTLSNSYITNMAFTLNIDMNIDKCLLKSNIMQEPSEFKNIIFDGINYIVVGQEENDALIFKFDNDLNVLAAKTYGGNDDDIFYSIAIDNDGNYIAVGYTKSEGQGGYNALIVKFNSDLTILTAKTYSSDYDDIFYSIAIDNDGNYIAVGKTNPEGQSNQMHALIVKFDQNLNILAAKFYNGSKMDIFYSVAIDNNDYIVVGYSNSRDGWHYDTLIVKFDSNLNVLAAKSYGGDYDEYFYSITIDSYGNYIATGITTSEGQSTGATGLIIKFNNSLTILNAKICDSPNGSFLYSISVDNNGNYIVVGKTPYEAQGYLDTLIVKLDNNLNKILPAKIYGDNNDEECYSSIAVDNNGNYIAVGHFSNKSLITKFYGLISGTFPSSYTEFVLADSNVTITDSNILSVSFNLTLSNSTLTLNNSNLTLANATYTEDKDEILT